MASNSLNLSFDEAQYWIWAQTPTWGYFSKPPMVAWIIAITTKLCGDSESCVRLGAPLAYLVASFAVYNTGRLLYDNRIGFWSAVVFITLPGVAFSAMVISVDPFLLMFWAVALAILIRILIERNCLKWWVFLGTMIGLGLLTKYAMLFFMISLLLSLIRSPMYRPLLRTAGPWLAISFAFVCVLPNLLWNSANGFSTFRHTGANIHLLVDSLFHPDQWLTFISTQFAVFGPIPMTVLVVVLIRLRQVASFDEHVHLLLSFVLPLIIIISVEAFISRAHANWSAPAFIAATVLIVAWLTRLNKAWLFKAAFILHLVATAILYNLDAVAAAVGHTFKAQSDPFKRIRGWEAIGRAVVYIRADHPGATLLFDSRKVLTPVVYYARPFASDAVIWNEDDMVTNHFELVTNLNQSIGQSFLLFTERHSAGHVAQAFTRTELVAVLRVALYTDFIRELRVFHCDGFLGYVR